MKDSNEIEPDTVVAGPKFINPNKKYGLIIPNKSQAKLIQPVKKNTVKPCIFQDEDDDESYLEENNKSSVKKPPFSSTNSNRLKKQTQIELEKALAEDPDVFDYDKIYDKLEEEKAKLDPKLKNRNESKEPKYIAGIMKAAAKRQMEFEKLQERKIQKERETEGDLWKDKETFVTSAYRKKMEERQLIEEEERRQEQIESLLDVRKQRDLSGFYSNLLKIKTGEVVIEEESEKERRIQQEQAKTSQPKHYRIKKEESSESEASDNENENSKIMPEDMDKDEEISDESQDEEEKVKKDKNDQEESNVKTEINKDNQEPLAKRTKLELKDEEKEIKLSKEKVKKLRLEKLFTKRTVDDKFEQELREYFQRKSTHLSLKSYIERD